MRTASIETFSGMIQKFYAAAADPSLWDEALRGMEDATGSAGATLVFVPKSSESAGFVLSGRFTQDVCVEFARDHMAACPRTNYALRTGGSLFYDSMILTEAQMDRDPVYDWFASLGLRYHIGGVLVSNDQWQVNISLQRSRKQGHVDQSDIDNFVHIQRHIGQALALSEMVGSLRSKQRASIGILDRLPQGVVILTANKQILYTNLAADRLLIEGQALTGKAGFFGVANPEQQAGLDRLVWAASGLLKGGSTDLGGWLTLERLKVPPLHLFIGPTLADLGTVFPARPAVIVVIHDRAHKGFASTAMLTDLFGLTRTEATLASLLGGGGSLEEAAAQLGHAVGTARNHLKSIFRKVGVERQQELVRVLATLVSSGLAAGHHPPPP